MMMDQVLAKYCQEMREEVMDTYDIEHETWTGAHVAKTVTRFDHLLTAPMFGFKCGSDYYRAAGCGNVISNVQTKCLFLHASNDPIVYFPYIKKDNFYTNPNLLSVCTSSGGHSMSWPTGWFTAQESWAGKVAIEYFEALVAVQE